MFETRSHISDGNVLHVAVISKHRAPPPFAFALTPWRIVLLILLAIPILVGLINLISRIADLYNPQNASAAALVVSQDSNSRGADSAIDSTNASTSNEFAPTHIAIPSIGVSASIERVGLNAQGAMQAPSSFMSVGWYGTGVSPGAPGNAVFDGHVNNALTKAGVFENLPQLQKGDQIIVSDNAGHSLAFVVQSVSTYPVDQAPITEIFSRTGPPGLALITCDGVWSDVQHQFSNRLVVYASLTANH